MIYLTRHIFFLTILSSSLLLAQRGMTLLTPEASEKRIALVIGNGTYEDAPLHNPPNDARAMASTLQQLDFAVISSINASKKEMRSQIERFGEELRNGGVGLFYYAGHGMQSNGRNYLIPVNATIQSEGDIEDESVSLDQVLSRMEEARNRLNIVILDACRNNPFNRRFRSASRGLGAISTAPKGTVIIYATAAGGVATDGDGENGLFTQELLREIKTPGKKLMEVFNSVGVSVQKQTNDNQVPFVYSSPIEGEFYFVPGKESVPETLADSTRSVQIDSMWKNTGAHEGEVPDEPERSSLFKIGVMGDIAIVVSTISDQHYHRDITNNSGYGGGFTVLYFARPRDVIGLSENHVSHSTDLASPLDITGVELSYRHITRDNLYYGIGFLYYHYTWDFLYTWDPTSPTLFNCYSDQYGLDPMCGILFGTRNGKVNLDVSVRYTLIIQEALDHNVDHKHFDIGLGILYSL